MIMRASNAHLFLAIFITILRSLSNYNFEEKCRFFSFSGHYNVLIHANHFLGTEYTPRNKRNVVSILFTLLTVVVQMD